MTVDYLLQQLREIGFSDADITAFITIIYNSVEESKDIESQLANSGNRLHLEAFAMLSWVDWYYLIKNYRNEILTIIS